MAVIIDMAMPKRCVECPMHNNSNDYCKIRHDFSCFVRAKMLVLLNQQMRYQKSQTRQKSYTTCGIRIIYMTALLWMKQMKYCMEIVVKRGRTMELIDKQKAIYIASGFCHPSNIAKELEKLPTVDAIPREKIDEMIAEIKALCTWSNSLGGVTIPYYRVEEIIHKYTDKGQNNEGDN